MRKLSVHSLQTVMAVLALVGYAAFAQPAFGQSTGQSDKAPSINNPTSNNPSSNTQPGNPQAQGSTQPTIHQRAQEVQQELIDIQQATLDQHPELRNQGEALEALITDVMEQHGATPEQDVERLQQLQQRAQQPGIDEAQRQEMAMEFQQIQQDLIRARQQAAQNEQVQAEQQEFQTAMLQAMQEQNPRTEELLAEMREIQVEQQRQLQQQQPVQPRQ